ncbi:MAG: acyl-CoA dehydrogenase family protein [Kofleriaceae bacterium]|nr:acyl-CoA dehydrogenase family protein [Kofleriaceae bacterium]
MSVVDLVAAARVLAARLPGLSAQHERDGALDASVVAELASAGLTACLLPPELGGHALAPTAYIEVLATLAQADAATAWVTMTASTSTLLAPYLARAAAERIWATSPALLLAGVFAPTGTVTITGDRATVRGRWQFTSGCRHAAWIAVGAMSPGDGDPASRQHVVALVPAGARGLTIADHWDVMGLRGTGSHDLVLDDVEVPADQIGSVFTAAPWATGPLVRFPLFGLLATGIAACGLGIAAAALDHVAASARTAASGGGALIADVGRLLTRLGAARAHLEASAEAAMAGARRGEVSGVERGRLRLAAWHAASESLEVTRAAFALAGGGAIRAGHPVGRALHDAEVMRSHRMIADKVVATASRAALGLGPVPPDL